jgi:gingipain R
MPAFGHGSNPVQKALSYDSLDRTIIDFTLGEFERIPVDIGDQEYLVLSLEDAAYVGMGEAGQPQLPSVSETLMIPDAARMQVNVLHADYHEVKGLDIAPSKGTIYRSVDPASVPYSFGEEYNKNAFFPGELAEARDPFVIRDVRGMVVDIFPFQYNPVTKVLRVYSHIEVEVKAVGAGKVNLLDRSKVKSRPDQSFEMIYANQFGNYTGNRLAVPPEDGDMLVICHGPFMAAMQPFVDWKNSIGISTTIVDVATIGNNSTSIKNHIKSVYNASNLAFVLLVGDSSEIKSGYYMGGLSDPHYSTMDSDWYPDIIVGRFSAQTVAHVETQVQRTLEYEQQGHDLSMGDWNTYGMGVASNQGSGAGHYGEADNHHMNLIRNELLAYGFTKVDQIYDYSGTKAMITNGLNEGRRAVHYCGHGSTTAWSTTGFSNSDVNKLQNVGTLPFISSVACVNGAFNSTCFAEAWMRATHNGEPAGAVACYMSSINQSWAPPMYGQGNHSKSGKYGGAERFHQEMNWSMGGEWYGGSCAMMDLAGSGGREMFMTWIFFGDPSLRVLGSAEPTQLSVDRYDIPLNTPVDVTFTISPGPEYADYSYALLSGVSGTSPGMTLPSGVTIPINFDAWTYFVLGQMNTPVFQNFLGTLDNAGTAAAILSTNGLTPLDPALRDLKLAFSALIWPVGGIYELATNPQTLTIVE